MAKALFLRIGVFVLGLVLGALVVFLVMYFTQGSSSCDTDTVETSDTTNSTGARANDSLKLLFVITRHGNRGGHEDYSLDPYPLNNTDYWPYGASALTPVGRVQAYNQGAKLRSLYNGFLPSTFKSADIYADSDLVERVVMSGELVLAGLYPPLGWQLWNPSVRWQPIALYTNSSDRSESIWSCERYLEEEEVTYNAFLVENNASITKMCNLVNNATGANVTASNLSPLFDKLISEDTEGYVLPSWTQDLYPDPLTALYGDLFLAMYAGSDQIVRLIVGEMFNTITENMQKKLNGTLAPDRKIYLYSGHDTTVLPLQVALGVDRASTIRPIKVGSALIVELHQDNDTSEAYVQVLYLEGSSLDSGPVSLSLPDCGNPCYFEAFLNSTQNFSNVSFVDECETSMASSTTSSTAS